MVPAGIPVPETSMPGASVLVEVRFLTTALVLVVLPVIGLAVKTSVEPVPGAVAGADSVICVAESTDLIVVPGRMLVPVTSMPGARVLVEVRFVTEGSLSVVSPVMGPAVNVSVTPGAVAVAGDDSVIWVAESTDLIAVPAGMPAPETNMPGARGVVEARFVTTAMNLVVLPEAVIGPVVKVSVTPVPGRVADSDSVIVLLVVSTERIVAPAGIPVPETAMPATRKFVEGRLVTTGSPAFVSPVMGPALKTSVAPTASAVAGDDSVIWVAESTDLIVVPPGMPVPETSMPKARELVEGRLVTTELALVVLPVMGPAVNTKVEPVPVAVAFADSVIWVAESTDLIAVPTGIPVPETSMPGARALVEVRLVTTALVLVVLPVIGLAVKASIEPVPGAVAFADSVI